MEEEWEGGFFDGLRGDGLTVAGTRSRVDRRHVRCCRADAALVAVNYCVLLGYPRGLKVMNLCIPHLHLRTVFSAAQFQIPPFPSRVWEQLCISRPKVKHFRRGSKVSKRSG